MRRTSIRPYTLRNQQGAGFIILTLFIAAFVILPCGLFAFELMRYNLITQELRNVTDAAALAGGAAMASAPKDLDLPTVHELAIQTAVVTFEQNSVASTKFAPTNVTVHQNALSSEVPRKPFQAILNIALVDDLGRLQQLGSSGIKKLHVQALYADTPAFTHLLNLMPVFVASAQADAGLPQLDLFICFDVSGSMDDQTEVTLVRRFWNITEKTVDYKILETGTIAELFKPPPTGTALNAFWPQNLSYGSYGGPEANECPWIFSEGPYPLGSKINRLRSGKHPKFIHDEPPFNEPSNRVEEQGCPPGNFDPHDPENRLGNKLDGNAYETGFTDLVVKASDHGIYLYPNIETCVEASRGNLENKLTFTLSKGGSKFKVHPELSLIMPTPGYYADYWTQAQAACEPISSARKAALKFLDYLNKNADVHFALDAFADNAGLDEADYWKTTARKIDVYYPFGGEDLYPIPFIGLDFYKSKFEDVSAAFSGTGVGNLVGYYDKHRLALGPTGKTNIVEPLHRAIEQLTNPTKTRRFSKKAILLFTDGVANEPYNTESANSMALKEARRAYENGIPIFTIGLSQNSEMRRLESELLGDGLNGSGKGIAYVSGNHAAYIPVGKGQDLQDAFQTVARNLVVLRGRK
ncbi:MAG: hypothetical protein C5B53_04955 [Candidatus Melainabacteria bacterium]|nr:MAG: hypothetical protein C5B53_04955 [Candidatus Melainabacteria bacterium]